MTNVQFANDEGDPGMGLELGLNAFSFGGRIEAGLAFKTSLEGVSEDEGRRREGLKGMAELEH